ncbi:MAG TPA: inositol 2-dehydrogenase [Caulobacteraceae bacterium]
MIEVALVGAGRIGAVHGQNAAAHRDLRLAAIDDPDGAAGAALAAQTGARLASLDEILADPGIAGVIIASPTAEHLAQATACIAAGKAVLLEKPLDLDLNRAQAAAGALSGRRLLVGFNRRFDPHFAALKAHLDSGAIGSLETLHIISHDPAPPGAAYSRSSGGLFKDMAIHDFDIARWLLGEEPVSVVAAASRLVDPDSTDDLDGDTAKVVLATASGRLAVISNSRRSGYGYDQRVEAFGAKGRAGVGNVGATETDLWTEAGRTASRLKHFFLDRYADAYRRELDHFADILAGRAAPAVSYADGLAALALAEAAALSARTGVKIAIPGPANSIGEQAPPSLR